MTTLAPDPLKWYQTQFEALPDYPSAVSSGIVPDSSHLENGGYHCSIEDLERYNNDGDYSNSNKLDKAPPVTPAGKEMAAADDISLSKSDMVKLYNRVYAVWKDTTDPRRKYINAWNVWNGVAGNAPDRFNFQTNSVSNTSKDHEWHTHKDHPRVYVDEAYNHDEAWKAQRAALSIAKGESKETWVEVEEDDMNEEQEQMLKQVRDWTEDLRNILTDAMANGKDDPVPFHDKDGVKSVSAFWDKIATEVASKLAENEEMLDKFARLVVDKLAAIKFVPEEPEASGPRDRKG